MKNELTKIEGLIYEIRGQKVMLDRDLARLYEVEVKVLNQAVKRNIERFPADFMFQLTQDEWDILRSQNVIAKVPQDEGDNLRSQFVTAKVPQDEGDNLRSQFATASWGGEGDSLRSHFATANKNLSKVRFLPYVFTEHGVLMLSNVLNSPKAVNMSIQIIRVFDKLRKYALEQTSKDVRIEEIHKLLMLHIENNDYKFSEYDETIKQIVHALNNLIEQPPKTKRIGFGVD